ncbi:hypothetical protein [Pedobacter faecalis]|uniref:hypothetical protein n=1 Tax=Pedobacter faecalis TaxID=3041495 RepID=UPI00254A9082|nr:hypothetical protein [Pedobacter sp. ELA7]
MTKSILTLTLIALSAVSAYSQSYAELLLGTWKIKKFQYGNHPNNNENHNRFIKYKSYTPTHFIVTEVDSASKVTTTSIFGTYEIKDSTYTETILHVNQESAFMIGKTFSFKLKFDGLDKMTSTGSFNDMATSELWERVVYSEKDPFGAKRDPLAHYRNQPLYILQVGEVKTKIEPVGDIRPLSRIPQEAISAINVLKDEEAIKAYGESGKYGVIIISILPARQEEVKKLLTEVPPIRIR